MTTLEPAASDHAVLQHRVCRKSVVLFDGMLHVVPLLVWGLPLPPCGRFHSKAGHAQPPFVQPSLLSQYLLEPVGQTLIQAVPQLYHCILCNGDSESS